MGRTKSVQLQRFEARKKSGRRTRQTARSKELESVGNDQIVEVRNVDVPRPGRDALVTTRGNKLNESILADENRTERTRRRVRTCPTVATDFEGLVVTLGHPDEVNPLVRRGVRPADEEEVADCYVVVRKAGGTPFAFSSREGRGPTHRRMLVRWRLNLRSGLK